MALVQDNQPVQALLMYQGATLPTCCGRCGRDASRGLVKGCRETSVWRQVSVKRLSSHCLPTHNCTENPAAIGSYTSTPRERFSAQAASSLLQPGTSLRLARISGNIIFGGLGVPPLLEKNNGWIALTPLDAQPEPANLAHLKAAVTREWPMSSLLDFLKEADLRIDFTEAFKSVGAREILDRDTLQRRLLLCLYGLGTNTGLKRMAAGAHGESYTDLLYVRRRFIHKEQLRHAIARVVDAIFATRNPRVWGEGTTACASDSKKFGAWDQNLMTEWHVRL